MKELKLNEVELTNELSSDTNLVCEEGGLWKRLNAESFYNVVNNNLSEIHDSLSEIDHNVSEVNTNLVWISETLTDGVVLFYCPAIKKVRIEFNIHSPSNIYAYNHNIIAEIPEKYCDYKSEHIFNTCFCIDQASSSTLLLQMAEIKDNAFCIYSTVNCSDGWNRFRGTLEWLIN